MIHDAAYFAKVTPTPAFPDHVIFIANKTAVTPSCLLAAAFAHVEHHVCLCLYAGGNQFHHLL
jgi:hypothetical protein